MICDGSILRFVEKKGKKKHQRLKPLVLLCFGCKAQQMVQDMVLEELDEDLFPLRGDDPSVTLRVPPHLRAKRRFAVALRNAGCGPQP